MIDMNENRQELLDHVNSNYEGEEQDKFIKMCEMLFQLMDEGSAEDIHEIEMACERRLLELKKEKQND